MISPEVFYLHIQGEQRGPYTIPQIDHLLNSGLIAEETLYWREGLDQWQPVTSLVRLRRPVNRWGKRLLVLSLVLIAAAVLQFFGSVALIGWKETNQHEYTARAAYWRARSVVRATSLPEGAIVQFPGFAASKVTLLPPGAATVVLHGDVTLSSGETKAMVWSVPMSFDAQNAEWAGGPVHEITP
jgi:hypothetical protein